ncbi:MAG TPA: hypothetical protein PLP75_06195 [Burkholderiales bacterium]|jgi:hypothetical protein|nr:hypothetical protein [Burkholderiales bacterium]
MEHVIEQKDLSIRKPYQKPVIEEILVILKMLKGISNISESSIGYYSLIEEGKLK